MTQTTKELKQTLQQLVETYNKAIETQQQCKEQIIAVNAVIQDRELENRNTEDGTSSSSKD